VTLPNFLIIGAQKSGTTSLYYYLKQHPEIYMSPAKEVHFFDNEGGKPDFGGPPGRRPMFPNPTGIEEYRAMFSGAKNEKAIGEASPSYMYVPKVPERIKHHIPEAKLIAVLRDPAERAYSAFLHTLRSGREPLDDFGEALRAEQGRVEQNWHHLYHYRARGLYHEQLLRYHEAFGPDKVRVHLYEDLSRNPAGVVQDICRFVGVDDSFEPDTSVRYNASGVPRSGAVSALVRRSSGALGPALKRVVPFGFRQKVKGRVYAAAPPMPEEAREELAEYYREDVGRLQDLIGRDLSGWLAPRRDARDAAGRPGLA
jgi:hypothetical protein